MEANLISSTDGIETKSPVNPIVADFMWFAPKKTDVRKDGEK